MAVQIVNAALNAPRMKRSPSHSFNMICRPFEIRPLAIAPVLPGETLKSANFQMRAVTDPLASSLIGWWAEAFIFYIKLTDLDPDIGDMFIDPDYSFTHTRASASGILYHSGGGGADWTKMCLDKVAEEFFWDDNGVTSYDTSTGLIPRAKYKGMNWTDSVILESDVTPDAAVGTGEISDLEDQLSAFEMMRRMRMAEMSFGEYLAQYGVRSATPASQGKPELIRYMHSWSYPSNTVNPSDGVPSSAVSWLLQGSADKDRYFKEPGFLFAVSVFRPKLYMGKLNGSLVQRMTSALHWFPPDLMNDGQSSIFKHGNADNLIDSSALPADPGDEHYYDLRDLLMYGDQMVNGGTPDTAFATNFPDFTTASGRKFVTQADVNAKTNGIWASTVADTKCYVNLDGVLALNIAGRQKDMT